MKKPNAYQKEIAAKLGIDVSRDSYRVAAARIREVVDPALSAKARTRPADAEQKELAKRFHLRVSRDTRLVASAKIQDRRELINKKLARKMGLKPGVKVVNKRDGVCSSEQEYAIRAISKDGVVFFEGGQRAWPMDLEKVSGNGQSSG